MKVASGRQRRKRKRRKKERKEEKKERKEKNRLNVAAVEHSNVLRCLGVEKEGEREEIKVR